MPSWYLCSSDAWRSLGNALGGRLTLGRGTGRGHAGRGRPRATAPVRRAEAPRAAEPAGASLSAARARRCGARHRSPPGEPSPLRACGRQSSRKHRRGEEGEMAGGIGMIGDGRGSRRRFLADVGRAVGGAVAASFAALAGATGARDRRALAVPVRAPRAARAARPAADRAAPPGLGAGPPHQPGDGLRPGRAPAQRSQPVPLSVPRAVGRSRASRCRRRRTSRACAATSPSAASC